MLDLLTDHEIAYPSDLSGIIVLTPFAAEMRYDYLPPEEGAEEPFDRIAVMRLVDAVLSWADSCVQG